MNPLTNVKNIQKLSEQELKRNFKTSWHDQYKNSAWIFVGGLPYDLTEGDVICVFSQYGEVVNMNLVRDKGTGKSKGFCFLCYEDQRSTILAVDNFNGMKILGRTIRVDHVNDYKPPKESKNVDNVTKLLYETGCAPGSSITLVTSEKKNEKQIDSKEGILKKVKREKKKKVKKQKKLSRKKLSKKKKRSKEQASSSSSSPESRSSESSESSSSEEEGAESVDLGGCQWRGRRDAPRGESKEWARVKIEEEEEEKKRVRKEQRTSQSRDCDRWNKSEEGHLHRSANGGLRVNRWGGQESGGERRRQDDDIEWEKRQAERRREERRRRRIGQGGGGGSSRRGDEQRLGRESEGGEGRWCEDEREHSHRRETVANDDHGKWEAGSSRRRGELSDDGHEREERRRRNRSCSPQEKSTE